MRGLKLDKFPKTRSKKKVAPFTGAWIETFRARQEAKTVIVAPFTGAWIETTDAIRLALGRLGSHPSRVRGLKLRQTEIFDFTFKVAPFTGAWIETRINGINIYTDNRRTLHGCVD